MRNMPCHMLPERYPVFHVTVATAN